MRAALVVDGLDRPGLYRLTQGGNALARVAVRFSDPAESDLAKLGSGRRVVEVTPRGSGGERVGSRSRRAAAAIALDWFVLRRARRAAEPTRGASGPDGGADPARGSA